MVSSMGQLLNLTSIEHFAQGTLVADFVNNSTLLDDIYSASSTLCPFINSPEKSALSCLEPLQSNIMT